MYRLVSVLVGDILGIFLGEHMSLHLVESVSWEFLSYKWELLVQLHLNRYCQVTPLPKGHTDYICFIKITF